MAKGVGSGNHSSPRAKPAKLSEQALGSVKTAALLGLGSEDCAALILAAGLAPKECPKFTGRTLRRMIERDPDVRQAADMGRATGRYRVAQAIFDMATQQDNLSAAVYWERTRNAPLLARAEALYDHTKAEDSAEYLNERFEKAIGGSDLSEEELEAMSEEEFEATLETLAQAKMLEQG